MFLALPGHQSFWRQRNSKWKPEESWGLLQSQGTQLRSWKWSEIERSAHSNPYTPSSVAPGLNQIGARSEAKDGPNPQQPHKSFAFGWVVTQRTNNNQTQMKTNGLNLISWIMATRFNILPNSNTPPQVGVQRGVWRSYVVGCLGPSKTAKKYPGFFSKKVFKLHVYQTNFWRFGTK